MGLLALTQLVYYTEHYPVEARRSWLVHVSLWLMGMSRALVHASHPTQWYPFAVTGINITRQSNPTDLMAFPAVFGMLQETIRLELAERTFA
ncbi:hypothetical protein DYB38_011166 [Aphanomyces astaci]|uniref:ELMO domain-containing protein n=1 Tax=Aphanomyces astaci TaxID=112090 RepID=A0A397CLH5_APHAT|nr:hypothetical protein DYB38_011166 [Aphanomyces astaci]